LHRPELAPDFAAQQEAFLTEARTELEAHPEDPMAWIWVGRRTAYLGRYREALEIYTRGIEQHPDAPRLYRHRGHRYITVREFGRAVADLERAVDLLRDREPEVEPDGLPNALDQPTGTTHSSAWYHLGLAHYLKGDFEAALPVYRECLGYSGNPDMQVATTYWLYRTLRRLGQDAEAAAVLEPISAELELIENHDYLELLLLAKGERTPEALLEGQEGLSAATLRYGIGAWYRENGEAERAQAIFREILEGDAWAAFGYIAAEAEVARGSG
jgi:tetratricopeptide (TPR) repeat protein